MQKKPLKLYVARDSKGRLIPKKDAPINRRYLDPTTMNPGQIAKKQGKKRA
jgi:hypothetical protein